jgi:hypothetical protein
MIQLSLNGIAKFATASCAGQRKVPHDFKYPNDEGQAQEKYYRDARDALAKYCEHKQSQPWLVQKAASLAVGAWEPNVVKVISQTMFEAALAEGVTLTGSQVLYVDVPRGVRRKGARFGALMRKNIEAACHNICAIWPALTP